MVDALREAHRVLTPSGVLIDVRPIVLPLEVSVIAGGQAAWAQAVETYAAPEEVAAAGAAARHAVSLGWYELESHRPFDFDIYCDSADELRVYAEGRQLYGAEIPYAELEERRRRSGNARLRCRRPWELTTYRRK